MILAIGTSVWILSNTKLVEDILETIHAPKNQTLDNLTDRKSVV